MISGCHIYSNTSVSQLGGGIYLDAGPHAKLINNQVCNNNTTNSGGGLYTAFSNGIALTGNVFRNNGAASGGGAYMQFSDSTLINNVFADNETSNMGSGLHLYNSTFQLLHSTFARNTGGDGSGIHVRTSGGSYYSVATLTNTILVSHSVGITVGTGCTATLAGTLWGEDEWGNDVPAVANGTVVSSGNVTGDPSFVAPDEGDYHITAASAAIDQGTSAWVSTDMDGDLRHISSAPDLGADESPLVIAVTKSGPDSVSPSASILYTLWVTNTGIVTVSDITLADTLPTGAFFVSASDGGSKSGNEVSWPVFDVLPNGGTVVRTFTVTATETITNADYHASFDGISVAGGVSVVTEVSEYKTYLPLVLRN
jgi:uncharacterized repeat protein (TIGR01451 family)